MNQKIICTSAVAIALTIAGCQSAAPPADSYAHAQKVPVVAPAPKGDIFDQIAPDKPAAPAQIVASGPGGVWTAEDMAKLAQRYAPATATPQTPAGDAMILGGSLAGIGTAIAIKLYRRFSLSLKGAE